MSEIFTTPVSAGLLQVLAEAAAGYMGPGDVYFMADYNLGTDGTYNLSGPLPTPNPPPNRPIIPRVNAVFGPFSTPVPVTIPLRNQKQQSVESVEVVTTGGVKLPVENAAQYDAMFSSLAAVMKFAVPYYTEVYSTEFANAAVSAFQESDLALMVHLPWSEYGIVSLSNTVSGPASDAQSATGSTHGDGGPTKWIPVVFERGADGTYGERRITPG